MSQIRHHKAGWRYLSRSLQAIVFVTFSGLLFAQGTRLEMPKNKYTVQQDVQLGRQAASEIEKQMPIMPENSESDRYVENVGRRLVEVAVEWVREAGYATVTLSTFVDVPWNAPFYETLGFHTVPDADHTPDMIQTRFFEAKAGFLVDRRVFMRRCGLRAS